MKLFNKRKTRTIVLNTIAEFAASVIFSLLFFIFISRHLSDSFQLYFITLSFAIGLSYFVSVYIPFYTYRIHIIPFISVLRALQKKNFSLIIYKVPAQIVGAFVGVILFQQVNIFTTNVDIRSIKSTSLESPEFSAFLNFLLTVILCYGFYIIRIIFKKRTTNGTVFMGLLIAVLFAFSGSIQGLSFLNPFGYLAAECLHYPIEIKSVWNLLLIHLIAPLIATFLAYYFINLRFEQQNNPFFRSKSSK
ncbi:MAG: aquaporin [Crocinitomicaceae bacterium]